MESAESIPEKGQGFCFDVSKEEAETHLRHRPQRRVTHIYVERQRDNGCGVSSQAHFRFCLSTRL
jgi:hypothetical protein